MWSVGFEPTKATATPMPRPLTYTVSIAGALPIRLRPHFIVALIGNMSRKNRDYFYQVAPTASLTQILLRPS